MSKEKKIKGTVRAVRYGRLLNLGNYENERVEVEILPDEGQSPAEALEEARAWVNAQLGLDVSEADYESAMKVVAKFERGRASGGRR